MQQPSPYSDHPARAALMARLVAHAASPFVSPDFAADLRGAADALGRPHVPLRGVEFTGGQAEAISGAACVFVQTLHDGEGIADALLALIDRVQEAGRLDQSGPIGGFAAEHFIPHL